MIVAEFLLCAAALVLLAPVCVLLVQVLVALPAHRPRDMPCGRRPAVAVLIPAHNEAALIGQTVRAIAAQLEPADRIVVVADNCSDDTPRVAAAAGAQVVERNEPARRGKGYAIDFGVRHLQDDPPEVVLVIDADCTVGAGAIERLAKVCGENGRPVQALYLMRSPPAAGLKTRIAEFAWRVKNELRALAFHRLDLPCQLTGTGMAFPWTSIGHMPLATGHIVEDMKLGIEFARAGTPPLFCPDARVTSTFPATQAGLVSQRTRWEHGHLDMILREARKLFAQALVRRDGDLMALAIDLCVPPLALLMLLLGALFAGSALFLFVAHAALPLALASLALVMSATAVLLAWGRCGRTVISFVDIVRAPFYALWKIPLYFGFLGRKQHEWVRTRRDTD